MEPNSTHQSGFELRQIALLDSSFHREDQVSFDRNVRNNLHIDTVVQVEGKTINVTVTVTINQQFEEKLQVNLNVKMVGVFECIGDSPLSNKLENFGRINGAAIIFPYIREYISSLSIKAGIPPIILPIINFQNRTDQQEHQ